MWQAIRRINDVPDNWRTYAPPDFSEFNGQHQNLNWFGHQQDQFQ